MSAESDAVLAGILAGTVGEAHVTLDDSERRYLSSDFFYWENAGIAAIVVAPADTGQVQAVLRLLAGVGREVVIRGGGMSTGRSYVPQTDRAVLLDMRRLNRIREINVTDRYLVAEAGCTWQRVLDALQPYGLRPDFTIPLSGSVATVGGAMAHHVTGGMKGIQGLEVVRANGDLIHTGSWARRDFPEPYYRDYGPDVTGLFLGDTGAFGVKTAVSLHLSRPPEASAFASFAFDSMAQQTEALVQLSALDFITLRSGFDPYLGSIVLPERQGESVWTVHLRAEQLIQAAADAGMARARAICLRNGREIAPTAAIAMGAGQLSVRGALSHDGERWIATNSIFPLSRAAAACAALQAFLADRQADLAAHDVKVGCFTTCSGMHFQLEPLFWWRDKVSELALRHIDPDEAARFREIPDHPENRAFITRTRHELRDLFQALGAIHVHTSKFFRYGELLQPGTRDLLRDLKAALDPAGMLNPGNLGL